jgi:hypothetical protein
MVTTRINIAGFECSWELLHLLNYYWNASGDACHVPDPAP